MEENSNMVGLSNISLCAVRANIAKSMAALKTFRTTNFCENIEKHKRIVGNGFTELHRRADNGDNNAENALKDLKQQWIEEVGDIQILPDAPAGSAANGAAAQSTNTP